ncbi:hypothetical protein ACFV3E_46525, partial [Streptomyces sp. NPDC059718]
VATRELASRIQRQRRPSPGVTTDYGTEPFNGHTQALMLYPLLRRINRMLLGWACQKYKRLRRREKRAGELLAGTARRYPNMFAHWRFGLKPDGWAMGAV